MNMVRAWLPRTCCCCTTSEPTRFKEPDALLGFKNLLSPDIVLLCKVVVVLVVVVQLTHT